MSFCPFLNETCKGNECMMWSNESCLVVNFMQTVSSDQPDIDFEAEPINIELNRSKKIPVWLQLASSEEIIEEYFEFLQKEFPDTEMRPYRVFDLFLQTKGLDETWGLPVEINMKIQKTRALLEIETRKRQESERQLRLERELIEVESLATQFLDWMEELSIDKVYKKNVSRFTQEQSYDLLWETESKIVDLANKGHDERKRVRIEAESQELPSLIDQCIDWARDKGFKSVTKSDIESFLIEYKIKITNETKRTLYSMTNTRLKSKK